MVAASYQRVVQAPSIEELRHFVALHAVNAAVIDPSITGDIGKLEQLADAYPSLPIVGYVPLTPAGFHAVAAARRNVLSEVILYTHDDSIDSFRAVLDRVTASPLTSRLLGKLEPKLSRLPRPLALSVSSMFREPHRYISANDLAVTCDLHTSRLYRCFEVADLASPKRMLIAAKLLRGYIYLHDPAHRVSDVARKLGYRKPRIFSAQSQLVFGRHASQVVGYVDQEAALECLENWCSS